MNTVILRCPRCGTTQVHKGECEACHEGAVRFYCTDHKPGRWLDSQVCGQCGAAFGRPDPRRSAPRTPKADPSTSPASRTGTSKTRGSLVSSSPRERPGPWGGRSPPTPPEGDYVSEEVLARARALKRLRDLLGGPYVGGRAPLETGVPTYSVAPHIAGGCLRFVLLLLLFLLLSFFGLSMLGSLFLFGF